jgi:hypothetical protein
MANLNLSQFTEKTLVADADWVFVWDTAGTISKKVSRNSLLNSGTLAASAPVTISQTWNNAAVAFTAFKVDATSTNSASGSLLLDLQVGGVSRFNVNKLGDIQTSTYSVGALGGGHYGLTGFNNGAFLFLSSANQRGVWVTNSSEGFVTQIYNSLLRIGGLGTNLTTILTSDADNTLALRNSTAAQTFNVYGTYTSGTSYERLTLSAPSAANAIIGTNKGSGGGTARGLELQTDGATRMTIPAAGGLSLTDGTSLFIGATSASAQLAGSVTAFNSGGRFLNAAKATTATGLKWLLYVDAPTPTNGHGIAVTLDGMQYFGGSVCDHIWTTDNNGTERMRIKHTTGNVGIGTTAPSSKLQVTGGDVEIETVTSGIIMKAAGTSTRYRITLNATGDALDRKSVV